MLPNRPHDRDPVLVLLQPLRRSSTTCRRRSGRPPAASAVPLVSPPRVSVSSLRARRRLSRGCPCSGMVRGQRLGSRRTPPLCGGEQPKNRPVRTEVSVSVSATDSGAPRSSVTAPAGLPTIVRPPASRTGVQVDSGIVSPRRSLSAVTRKPLYPLGVLLLWPRILGKAPGRLRLGAFFCWGRAWRPGSLLLQLEAGCCNSAATLSGLPDKPPANRFAVFAVIGAR